MSGLHVGERRLAAPKGKYHDLVANADKHLANLRPFFMDVNAWRSLTVAFPLKWARVRFADANKTQVPKERGIYAFTVAHEPSLLPQHGYIMYIGIAGQKSNGTLNARYRKYLSDLRKEDGRPRVFSMLSRWDGCLFFSFAPVPDQTINLKLMETAFLDALRPPINKSDFSAAVSQARTAAWQ